MSIEQEQLVIQYVPFKSFVHPSFWHNLTEIKLNIDRLYENKKNIYGRYTYSDSIGALLEIDGTSFNTIPEIEKFYLNIKGTLINKNTLEDFRNADKAFLLNSFGEEIWSVVKSKIWITNPNSLLHFVILTHADLKKFHYYYWFGFPCPSKPVVNVHENAKTITTFFSTKQLQQLETGFKSLDINQRYFFIVEKSDNRVTVIPLSKILDARTPVHSKEVINLETTYFAFADSSNVLMPAWPLRLFIAALLDHCPSLRGVNINVVGLRCNHNESVESSQVFQISIPQDEQVVEAGTGWVGWERTDKGTFGPRLANMSASMDPIKLADSTSDLNVKLMKWRLVPNINVDVMKNTKCLLLGAGTLGCHVARDLLAWGFRQITFIDQGKVSYSNPTRQVLFTHEDCLHGGRKKAEAAAANLKLILPTVNSRGICARIGMPGFPVGESLMEEFKEDLKVVTEAILENDVIFLLLDSREARWLPTVIGALHGKVVINAALGFDSYLVMRHGIGLNSSDLAEVNAGCIPGGKLGCYFCNDVTAPGNSFKDRTLDQQCTVTRPGVAAIAGALAVEVLVGLLQHPLRVNAPAVYNLNDNTEESSEVQGVFGPIPHSIRGFLHSYQTIMPTCAKFKQCIACSDVVLRKYKEEGEHFLIKVFESGKYLEEVTGLKDLHSAAETIDVSK